MRANKPVVKKAEAPPPGVLQYAISSARTKFGDGGEHIVVTEEGAVTRFSCKGTPFGTLEIQGAEMVVTFRAPSQHDLSAEKLAKYTPAKTPGWLEFRTGVSRDPRPWLQAGFGSLIGRTHYELLQGGMTTGAALAVAEAAGVHPAKAAKKGAALKIAKGATAKAAVKTAKGAKAKRPHLLGPTSSAGGPYLVLPEAAAAAWRGAKDPARYRAVCKGADEGHLTKVSGADALVLGTPDLLFALERPDGAVFARAVSHDSDDEAAIEAALAKLPSKGWSALGRIKVGKGPLLAFDSASAGSGREGLVVNLAPGAYAVSAATLVPDSSTELLVTRLVRAPGR